MKRSEFLQQKIEQCESKAEIFKERAKYCEQKAEIYRMELMRELDREIRAKYALGNIDVVKDRMFDCCMRNAILYQKIECGECSSDFNDAELLRLSNDLYPYYCIAKKQ